MERTRRQNPDTDDGQHGSLGELRDEIEEIDSKILDLVARRTYVAESIARVKAERDMPIHDPDREEKVLERVAERARELDMDDEAVRDVYDCLMELSKRHQRDCNGDSDGND